MSLPLTLPTNFTEVWAVPGAHSVIDVIDPASGLTAVFRKPPAAVLEEEPRAVRMTWDAWIAEQAARQHAPITWAPTTPEAYDEMLNVLPLAVWRGHAFLVGEPMDHDYSTGAPRFSAYWRRHGAYVVASRPLTRAEFLQEIGR